MWHKFYRQAAMGKSSLQATTLWSQQTPYLCSLFRRIYSRLFYRIPSSGQWRLPQWEDHHPYFYGFHPQKKVKAVSVEKFLQKPDWKGDKRLLAFKQLTIDDFLSDFENHWWDRNWVIVEYRILEYQMEYFMVSLIYARARTIGNPASERNKRVRFLM